MLISKGCINGVTCLISTDNEMCIEFSIANHINTEFGNECVINLINTVPQLANIIMCTDEYINITTTRMYTVGQDY